MTNTAARSRNPTKRLVPPLSRRQRVLSVVSNELCNSRCRCGFTCFPASGGYGIGLGQNFGTWGLHEVSLGHFRAITFSGNNAAAELPRCGHYSSAEKAPLQVPPCNREPVHAEENGALQAQHS